MNNQNTTEANNKKTLLTVFFVVFSMIVLSFASVPLYDLFCRVTGFAGTTQIATEEPQKILARKVTVRFSANKGRNMPWSFRADQKENTVQIGEKKLASFTAKNTASVPVAGTAIFNVTPQKAGKYFHKIQCFCFDEQVLQPGESVHMPVVFFIDPSLADDPRMDDVKTITLSYTFFKTETQELEEALEDFYNESALETEQNFNTASLRE